MDTSIHPFRLLAFGTSEVVKGRGKRARVEQQGFGYVIWNPDEETAARAGRPGFGSFDWHGMDVTRRRALDELVLPGIHQVQVRTNQDRLLFTFYRCKWAEYVGQAALPFAA